MKFLRRSVSSGEKILRSEVLGKFVFEFIMHFLDETCEPKFSLWGFFKLNGGIMNRIMDTMLVDKEVVKQQEDIRMLREGLMEGMSFLGNNQLLLNTVLVQRTKGRTMMNLSLVLGS